MVERNRILNDRRAWPWVLPVVVAVGAILFLGSEGDRAEVDPGDLHAEERSPDRVAASPREGQAPDAVPRPVLRGAPLAPPDGARATPDTTSATPPEVAAHPVGAAAVLSVVLDLPPAWLEGDGWVYALPAGAPGEDVVAELPRASAKGARRVDLALPKTGLWDVGFACDHGHAIETDVAVPGMEEVVLHARGAAPVRLRAEGVPADFLSATRVRLRLPDDTPEVNVPGRGQRRDVRVPRAAFDEAGLARTPPLPPGVPFQVVCYTPPRHAFDSDGPGQGIEPDRHVVYAGEEVVLRRVRLGVVRVHLSFRGPLPESWKRFWKTNLWTAASATALDGGSRAYDSTYLLKDGKLKDGTLVFALRAGDYRFDIGVGRAYVTEVRQLRVEAGTTQEVRAVLVPSTDFTPGGPLPLDFDWATKVTLRVEGASSGTLHVLLPMRDDTGETQVGGAEYDLSREHPLDLWEAQQHGGRAQALVHPSLASEVFEVPRRGEVPVRLQPAGRLVVVPEVEPDASLGILRIRRSDGWPIPWTKLEGKPTLEAALEVTVVPGLQIGPFLAGEHRFEILLGGVVVGGAKVRVRAGRITPLPLVWTGR